MRSLRDAERRGTLSSAPPFVPDRASRRRPVKERCLFLRWYYDPVAADRHDTEVVATVLLPAGFVVLGANRALLAVRHEVEAICCNSVVDEVPLGACRTALAEGQVVLIGATLVSVTLDTNPHSRVSLQPWNLRVECCSRIRSDRRLVEVEVDRAGDLGRVDRCNRCDASRIHSRDVRVVLAHCRRRRWRRRRGRSNAVRARSRNALEAGVRAHNLRTRTTQQEAQSTTDVDVHVGAALVIRHVIEHAVETKRGTIRNAKTETREGTAAVVVVVAQILITSALELVTGARGTRTDDELALPARQEAEWEVVVQTQCKGVRVDRCDAVVRSNVVVLRRIVPVAFDLPLRIGEEHADTSTVAKSILGNCDVIDTRVIVEERPLHEAAELDGSRKRSIHLVPPLVRGPHYGIRRSATAEQVAQIWRKLKTRLGAEIKLAAIGREIIQQTIDAQ